MGGYAFNYLRADREEKMLGPYAQEEAEQRRSRLMSFGAVCSEIFPTKEDPSVEKDNYAEKKVAEFGDFFRKEMALFKIGTIGYYIIYQFMLTMIYHIKLYVAEHDWSKSKYIDTIIGGTGHPPNFYLEEVAKIISREASHYSPADGSVWESLAKELNLLAKQIKSGKMLDKKKAQEDLISSFSKYSL
jgi:hypothetical protein